MADDLSSAPAGGGEVAIQTVDTPASAPSPAPEAKADKPLSNRDAIRQALAQVETRQPNETEKAAAVLKEGAGADDQLAEDRRTAAQKAIDETTANNVAAERARKGWETRRANQEKAELANGGSPNSPPASPGTRTTRSSWSRRRTPRPAPSG